MKNSTRLAIEDAARLLKSLRSELALADDDYYAPITDVIARLAAALKEEK